MSITRADVGALITNQFLKSYPYVGLYILDQVAEVDGAIGIGQSTRHEYLALGLC